MSEERKAAERLAVKGIGAVIIAALLFWAVPQIWDKLSPFIIAIPLAAALQPVVRFAQDKLKIRRGISVLICVLLLLGLVIGFTFWAVSIITEQAPQLVGQSGNLITEAVNTLQRAFGTLMENAADNFSPKVQELIRDAADNALFRISSWGTQAAADVVSFTVNVVTGLPYGVIYISFLAMALYFIATHYNEIRSYLPGGKRRRQDSNTTQLTNSALRSLMGYLRVQGVFALIVFVVSLISLRIFGFHYSGAIALAAGLMEMIPMIGSGLLYILMGIVFLVIGNTAWGVQVLALTACLQLLRRVLEPKLMSDNIGISPLLSLIGMFVGMRVGGILGLIGGPVAMAVLVGAVRGDVFKSVSDDTYLIVEWFKRRWAKKPAEEEAAEAAGEAAEESTETQAPAEAVKAAEETAEAAAKETEKAAEDAEEKEIRERRKRIKS